MAAPAAVCGSTIRRLDIETAANSSVAICEQLAWASHHAKRLEQKGKFACHDIVTVGADGKDHAMLSMPVEKLPLWLASIKGRGQRKPTIVVRNVVRSGLDDRLGY